MVRGSSGAAMRKQAFFDDHWGSGWPDPKKVETGLTDPYQRARLFDSSLDGGSFFIEGLYGTEGLGRKEGLVTAALYLHINPLHGAKLVYNKWDGRARQEFSFDSKGDLTRLGEFVRSMHGTPLSVGLFIPFEKGWQAIRDFMSNDGELPQSIEWIATKDLPPGTFPDPTPPSIL